MLASGPAAAARPVEAGLGPARDGWPPTSALALLVKMAAVAIAATVVQSLSAQARLSSVVCCRISHTRAPRDPPKSCSLEPRPTPPSRPQLLSSPEDWCLICCLPADAAGEPGGPLYFKEKTIGSFGHQSEITREQLSLPLASPPSPSSGSRGILWVVGAMKYSDRHLAGLFARPPDRVELIETWALSATGPAPASAEG
ncbi:hypothetical protein EMIHUDRAFT_366276 [Emiliania huxleyi CCMP1516]|uniref:Uncharacterized protein n=2 Tax=Emiliania huxleyi TaxID=2903 RepID=A0A0D3JXK5_EMIH1|nr:hypothetical protein EMIHUDRAFT_366276 [Emiliania huxleyi CCMP1516]EOD28240.1 hypothetical protein EMIHUDRAFT_366276 [Emiliania huxleyi CCMP1516]|eukprot:XP_005780669.1 hypothetical protein EMIHUDRAFT_366276 [Emiliania huxleyi CCMP1516]